MSIFGSMRTAVSGMGAQANKLSTVSDNIANVNTYGYKSATASFSSLVIPSNGGNYQSGSVETNVESNVTAQGDTVPTDSPTNLAIQGSGFFMVQSPSGQNLLTRAGDFTPDDNGNLVNSAGMMLLAKAADDTSGLSGFNGLVPVNVDSAKIGLTAEASTTGTISGNLNSAAALYDSADGTSLPSSNVAPVTPSAQKTSVVGYDSTGTAVTYDVYFTKIAAADTTASPPTGAQWEATVYRADQATTGGTTSFPYLNADGSDATPVATNTIGFDLTGKLNSGASLTLNDTVSGGSIAVDFSSLTQLASASSTTGKMDGRAPSSVASIDIDASGVVSAVYKDSSTSSLYKIPLSTVTSPDNLTLMSGNVYQQNNNTGTLSTGYSNTGQFGSMESKALEQSTVDLASQLTDMIEANKSYAANSKVFQTGGDLMDIINNLVR